MAQKLGNLRAIYVVCICCMGSFLFSYDTGIIGGILTLASFEVCGCDETSLLYTLSLIPVQYEAQWLNLILQKDFRYTKAQSVTISANAVSVLQGGAFFGCFMIFPIAARYGRRWSLVIASIIFELGCILQIINSHSIACFFVGRVISGLGVGAATVLVPIYAAEMSPKEIRGSLGSCFQLFFAGGVCVSYWVDYAVKELVPPTTKQWRIPIALQLIPGGLIGLGMLLIPESARWLVKRGSNEKALKSLIWVRGGNNTAEVRAEFAEIIQGIEEEVRATEGVTWRELWLPSNRLRIAIAITLQLCQQLTGNTSLAYYAPQIFSEIGAGTSNLLITGFFGIVKLISVSTFVIFIANRIGRKTAFMGGAFAMGTCMLIIACIVATHPPPKVATGHINSAGAAGIAFVYLEAMSYNLSWGPVAWLYIGEIFPSRIREFGVAAGAGSQWLFNFMMSQVTPHAIANIGWRTFLMFAVFNYAIIAYSWWVLRETAGRSLEEMETVWGSAETAFDVEAVRAKAAAAWDKRVEDGEVGVDEIDRGRNGNGNGNGSGSGSGSGSRSGKGGVEVRHDES
ncbi:hypothetical protein MMC25_001498 [Agyrium rufum]|nr:hypothetical protein [Agyrium rufum]